MVMAIPSIVPAGYWGEGDQGRHRSPRPAISPNCALFCAREVSFFLKNPNISQHESQKNISDIS